MRALLIVNPHASSTTAPRRDVIASALRSVVELEVVHTRYRGHAAELAGEAVTRAYELVFTLGGDGTINEVVNGMLTADAGGGGEDSSSRPGPGELPALGPIPGGMSNVFVRALGIPPDPIDATAVILKALQARHERCIGLGLADVRYFTFSAGLGLDAEVIRAVEGHRAGGCPASPALYVWAAVRQFYGVTDRRRPALTLERRGRAPVGPMFIGIVSNTSPWTYLGKYPINPTPLARFDTGLDVFGLRELHTLGTLNALRQMLSGPPRPPSGRHMISLHDEAELTIRATRPIACQVDGEYIGESECVSFHSVPRALRVVA